MTFLAAETRIDVCTDGINYHTAIVAYNSADTTADVYIHIDYLRAIYSLLDRELVLDFHEHAYEHN